MKAMVFQIIRTSLHDGDGVRTVVYLKGCSMWCRWCHNPEGQRFNSEILYYSSRCIGCGRCVLICPECHQVKSDGINFFRELCIGCGKCTLVCPNEALVTCGREMDATQVLVEVMKDKLYYERTGGGITLSGGECLLFPEFCRELIVACLKQGISAVIETGLHVPWKNIETVLPVTRTFIADVKHGDDLLHTEYTGVDMIQILDNLDRLNCRHKDVRVRIPLIPGVNDGEWLEKIGARICFLNCKPKEVELLRFNPASRGKYQALGKGCDPVLDRRSQTDEEMEKAAEILRYQLPDIKVFYK